MNAKNVERFWEICHILGKFGNLLGTKHVFGKCFFKFFKNIENISAFMEPGLLCLFTGPNELAILDGKYTPRFIPMRTSAASPWIFHCVFPNAFISPLACQWPNQLTPPRRHLPYLFPSWLKCYTSYSSGYCPLSAVNTVHRPTVNSIRRANRRGDECKPLLCPRPSYPKQNISSGACGLLHASPAPNKTYTAAVFMIMLAPWWGNKIPVSPSIGKKKIRKDIRWSMSIIE